MDAKKKLGQFIRREKKKTPRATEGGGETVGDHRAQSEGENKKEEEADSDKRDSAYLNICQKKKKKNARPLLLRFGEKKK